MVVMEGLSKYNYLPVNYLNQIGGVLFLAAPNKATSVRPPTTHHENYQN